MTNFVWNLLLALAWTAITGTLTPENLALGMIVGFIALSATRPVQGLPGYSKRLWKALELALYVACELVLSNLRVALDVVRGPDGIRPAVVDIPLTARSDTEITLLAAVLTLTPGTTAIAVSPDRQTMYVHLANLRRQDVGRAREHIKSGFERRVLEVLR